jgi:hypothetical protein
MSYNTPKTFAKHPCNILPTASSLPLGLPCAQGHTIFCSCLFVCFLIGILSLFLMGHVRHSPPWVPLVHRYFGKFLYSMHATFQPFQRYLDSFALSSNGENQHIVFKFAFLSSETLKECEEALKTRLPNQGPLFIGPPNRNSQNSRPGSNHLGVERSLAPVMNVIRKESLNKSPSSIHGHMWARFPPSPVHATTMFLTLPIK